MSAGRDLVESRGQFRAWRRWPSADQLREWQISWGGVDDLMYSRCVWSVFRIVPTLWVKSTL